MERATILDCTKEQKTSGAGKVYTKYNVKYNDNMYLNTIDTKFGDHILANIGKDLNWELQQGKYGMEIVSIEGVVKEQRTGGGGGRKYSPEDIARMEKRDKETNEHIARSVALNDATTLMAAVISKTPGDVPDPARETMLVADVFLGWLKKGDK